MNIEEVTEPAKKKPKFDVFSKPQIFWKIIKQKHSIQIFCCKECNEFNYKNDANKKFKAEDGRLYVTVSLCPTCVKSNYFVTDLCMNKTSI